MSEKYEFTPDYDTYSTRPDDDSPAGEWMEYADHLETMCKYHELRLAGFEWQDISTLPKNVDVLFYDSYIRAGQMYVTDTYHFYSYQDDAECGSYNPTHWMHLPVKPEGE